MNCTSCGQITKRKGMCNKCSAGKAADFWTVKSCGKAHAGCKICRPDMVWNHSPESSLKTAEEAVRTGRFAGPNNGNWRGGPLNSNGPGWKAARRVVWERDKVCRACGVPPYANRKLDVHHVIERRDGGTNEIENLVGLHHGWHMKVHAKKMEIRLK